MVREISPKNFFKSDPAIKRRILTTQCIDDDIIQHQDFILLMNHLKIIDENAILYYT